MYVYIYVCVCVCRYICMYVQRKGRETGETGRERKTDIKQKCQAAQGSIYARIYSFHMHARCLHATLSTMNVHGSPSYMFVYNIYIKFIVTHVC